LLLFATASCGDKLSPEELLPQVPKDCLASVTIGRPTEVLDDIRTGIALTGGLTEQITEIQDEVVKAFGFNPLALDELIKAGIDPNKPVNLTILAASTKLRRGPGGADISFGISDAKAARATVIRLAKTVDEELVPKTIDDREYLCARNFTVTIERERMHLMFGPGSDHMKLMSPYLTAGEQQSLTKTPEVGELLTRLNADNKAFAYINIADVLAAGPSNAIPFVDAARQLALTTNGSGFRAVLNLRPSSILTSLLTKKSKNSSEFLAAWNRPLLATTLSLDDPMTAMLAAVRETGGGREVASFERAIESQLDLDPDELSKMVRQGAIGLLIYPNARVSQEPFRTVPFSFVAFIKIPDREHALKTVATLSKTALGGINGQNYGDNVLYIDRSGAQEMVIGVIGKHFVFGSAADEMALVAKGRSKGWQPPIKGQGVFELWTSTRAWFDLVASLAPLSRKEQEILAKFDKMPGIDDGITCHLNVNEDALVLDIKSTGDAHISEQIAWALAQWLREAMPSTQPMGGR
jgi:hypothetical protein